MQNGLMTDDEIAQLVASGDAVSSPEAIQSYFNSPTGKEGLANQQLGVDKWKAVTPVSGGGTNNKSFLSGSPEWAVAWLASAYFGFSGLNAALAPAAASALGTTAGTVATKVAPGVVSGGAGAIPAGVADVITVTAPAIGGIAPVVGGVTGGLAGASTITGGGGGGAGGAVEPQPAPSALWGDTGLTPAEDASLLGNVSQVPKVAPTFFQRVGSFLSSNKDLIGSALAGYGKAVAESDAQRQLLKDKAEITRANYRGTNASSTYRGLLPDTQTMTPQERFGPHNFGGWEYQYDPKVGKVVRVQIQPTQQGPRSV